MNKEFLDKLTEAVHTVFNEYAPNAEWSAIALDGDSEFGHWHLQIYPKDARHGSGNAGVISHSFNCPHCGDIIKVAK